MLSIKLELNEAKFVILLHSVLGCDRDQSTILVNDAIDLTQDLRLGS
jgi:hypothetical protein